MFKTTQLIASFAVLTAIATAPGLAAPTAQVGAGQTSVELSDDFLGALVALEVAPAPIVPGSLVGATISFPIPGGALDLGTARGDIFHTGGLTLTAGDTVVGLLNFIIDTQNAAVLTGLVTVNGDLVARVPLFDLELTQGPEITGVNTIIVGGVNVTLTAVAADALNDILGVVDFVEGFPIGVATVVAQGIPTDGGDDEDDDEDEDDDSDSDSDDRGPRRLRSSLLRR